MTISRRTVCAGAALGAAVPPLAWAAGAPDAGAAPGVKVLRYAFEVAETSLDPAKINDLYSRTLTPHIYEALYAYDHLARPVKIKPLTADGMPQHSDDFRVWTVRVRPRHLLRQRPGVQGQAARAGRARTTSTRSSASPTRPIKSPVWSGIETEGYLGLDELRQRALDEKKPFDYDREIEGVRALDRYTVRFAVEEPRPRFLRNAGGERPVRRGRARGGRVLRRAGRGAPGRHRPVQARAVAAQLAHRVRAQPRLPRDVLRRRAERRRRRGPGARQALQGPAPADGRPRRDLDHRGGAAALARVRQRRGRRRLPRRLPVRAAGDAERQGRAEPRQARHPRLSDRRAGEPAVPVQHGRPGGRRLQPGAGRAAPRDRARRRHQRKIIAYAYNGLGTVAQGPTLPQHHRATTRS